MEKFLELRKKYPVFIYDSYEIKEMKDHFLVTFNFEVPGLTIFNPTWEFPKVDGVRISKERLKVFEKVVFNLGMVEVISYLKATCSPTLIVNARTLNKNEIEWYKKLYVNGLGEFFYRNNLISFMDFDTFLTIKCDNVDKTNFKLNEVLSGNIIPVGGGKDSVLSMEVLKNMDNLCYIVNPRGASMGCATLAGYRNKTYTPTRTLDKRLLDLNRRGFLNGHTPFSAILAFSSYASAILLGRKYIVVSNEASANEANVKGTNINHQYSKSIEFENDFREYVSKYICENGPIYFSLLRPLSEWQIVKAFIKNPKYFNVFKSCNVGSKEDIWCEKCPKCLYVYIMLKAFLDDDEMKKIFKTDMLDDIELKDIFNGLVYPDYDKPFECVGTKEEINLCLNMILDKYLNKGQKLPVLLRNFDKNIYDLDSEIKRYEISWNEFNNLEPQFIEALRAYIK